MISLSEFGKFFLTAPYTLVLYIIIVTPVCNLKCRYCGGSLHGMPEEISYDMNELANFIEKDKEAVVAFYGGEPLLKAEKVKKLIDILPAKKFVLQTNGFFIEKLGDYIHKFDSILLSIDGRKEITDFYRCPGCYERVMNALKYLLNNDFDGEIIARMAVSYKTDIYEDVMHLLKYFPFVHWQLDAVWSNLWGPKEFKEWAEKNYKPGIKKLINIWIENMDKGKILGIVPFLGIASRILHGGIVPPCGAGKEAIAITTDGKILACPIAPDFQWNVLGDFHGYERIEIGEPCKSCDIYGVCGGRCLFAYKEKLWGEEGFREICEITKFTITGIKKHMDLLSKYKMELRYPPYNNTTEIIP